MTDHFKDSHPSIKLTILLAGSSLILVTILVIQLVSSSDHVPDQMTPESYTISDVTFHSAVYTKEKPVSVTLDVSKELSKETARPGTVWLGFSLLGPLGEVIDLPATKFVIDGGQKQSFSLSHDLNDSDTESLISGAYTAVFALWDKNPDQNDAARLTSVELPDVFRLYNEVEEFQSIDETKWFSRNGILSRTQLLREHVSARDDLLTILMPADTLGGGEIQTTDLKHYGSYEISMKLPDAPSSLTGFFLYKAPDFQYEIDIEVFNQPDSQVLFTSYAEGSTQHEDKADLAFDPTADFHRYRIDYYPDRVSFYIDDDQLQTWEDGFPDEPMHLMVNTWFPKWLGGTPPDEDQTLMIEWIRY